jgi:hypothetical protein
MSVTITLSAKLADELLKVLKAAKPSADATVKVVNAGAGQEYFKIKTFTQKIKENVKTLLVGNGFEFPEDDKMSKIIYDGFKTYVSENSFENVEEACKAFPKYWSEKSVAVSEEPTKKKTVKKTPAVTPKVSKDAVVLTIEELQHIKDLDAGDTPGVYWDSASGRNVTGPASDPDEEMKDVIFEGDLYTIGQTTYRVYQGASAKNSFKGYAGVANFKDMC